MIIICRNCQLEIYRFLAVGTQSFGAPVNPEDFTPLGEYDQPCVGDQMLCPACGEEFFYRVGDQAVSFQFNDGRFWPYPPPAVFGREVP